MVDSRFFDISAPISIEALAQIGGCHVSNHTSDDQLFHDVSAIATATEKDVTFLNNTKYISLLGSCKAGACILEEKYIAKAPKNMVLLVSDNPYASYAKIATAFHPETVKEPAISDQAVIAPSATIGTDCTIEAGVTIGENVTIGDGCRIASGTYITQGVIVGAHCIIHANVTISHAIIGDYTTLHTGVRIGQEGFGFATDKGQHIDVPQLGRVVIGNHVNIGANSCIDRGAGPDTVIGDGCRIDNLVQIGHNAQLGKGCVIVSHVGISGSTKLGDYVVLGGQVGVAGHLNIGSGVQVAAQSGITQDIPDGNVYGGSPAVPVKQWHRQTVAIKKLIEKKA